MQSTVGCLLESVKLIDFIGLSNFFMKLTPHILAHLPYLGALYRCGSFTRAAQTMHITQAAMSYQIKQLEDKLQTALVLRQPGSKLGFTLEGKKLVQEYLVCEKRLELLIDAWQAEPLAGRLNLSAPVDLGSLLMPRVMAQLQRLAPALRVSLHISDDLVDLHTASVDMAIRANPPPGSTEGPPIFASPLCLVARSAYLQRGRGRLQFCNLEQHTILVRAGSSLASWRTLYQSQNATFTGFKHTLALGTTVALREAAVEGLGIALLPHYVVETALASGQLQQLLRTATQRIDAIYSLARLPLPQLSPLETLLRRAFAEISSPTT